MKLLGRFVYPVWTASFGAEGVLMIAIFALLGGVLLRRRLGHNKTQPVVSAGQAA